MRNARLYGYCVSLRILCRWHPRIVSCSIRSTAPRVFFHSHFSKELVLYEMYFFSSLNNCNPPYSFLNLPPTSPSTRRGTMWPDRSTTLNNTGQSILAPAGRKSSPIVTTLRAIYNIETSSKYGSSSPALALLSHYTNTCRISIVSHLHGDSLFLQQFWVTQLIKNSNVVTKHSCLCSQKTTNGRFRKLNCIW